MVYHNMKLSLLFLFLLAGVGLINVDAFNPFEKLSFFNGRRVGGLRLDPIAKKECEVCKYTTHWFRQKLNHSEPSSKTWWQKYQVNDEFYDPEVGGPVFLSIGGEDAIDGIWMTTGQWVKNARTHGALLFQLEHRYYGQSRPTRDMSSENLKHLTSEQALADLASFVVAMNKKYDLGPDVKWIVFGGSYPGNLAAWFRAQRPDLIHGAVASSAPVLAKVDYPEYLEVVYESLKVHSEECVVAIKDAVDATDALMQASNYTQLNNIYYLCEPLSENQVQNKNNVAMFYQTLAGHFAEIVQYNNDNANAGTSDIDYVCSAMLDESVGTPIQRLSALLDSSCIYYQYDDWMTTLSDPRYGVAGGFRQWVYQTCTEFGYFQSSNRSHMFTDQIPLEYFIDMCKDAFDVSFDADFIDKAVADSNAEYGGLDIKVDRVAFVHGTIDPWHALGITETKNPSSPAILIEGGSHCQDMNSDENDDLPQLIAAREQISELIASWLEEA